MVIQNVFENFIDLLSPRFPELALRWQQRVADVVKVKLVHQMFTTE